MIKNPRLEMLMIIYTSLFCQAEKKRETIKARKVRKKPLATEHKELN